MQNNGSSPDIQTVNPFLEHFSLFEKTRLFDRLQQKVHTEAVLLPVPPPSCRRSFGLLSLPIAKRCPVFLFVEKLIPSPIAV